MKGTAEKLYQAIEEADMLLIGLGEEWEGKSFLKDNEQYLKACRKAEEKKMQWVLPYITSYYLNQGENIIAESYRKIDELVKDKNYFVISTGINALLFQSPLRQEKIVTPCGAWNKVQCSAGCGDSIREITPDSWFRLEQCITGGMEWECLEIGYCPHCGDALVFNNIYAEKYAEEGYHEQWVTYTKWLQGTLNKKLSILELGVGMQYPSVIRWPFEKIAFYNQKSVFIRVHETLSQMTEELAEKGYSIPVNAVNFFHNINGL